MAAGVRSSAHSRLAKRAHASIRRRPCRTMWLDRLGIHPGVGEELGATGDLPERAQCCSFACVATLSGLRGV
jgi:hypothetical protein